MNDNLKKKITKYVTIYNTSLPNIFSNESIIISLEKKDQLNNCISIGSTYSIGSIYWSKVFK